MFMIIYDVLQHYHDEGWSHKRWNTLLMSLLAEKNRWRGILSALTHKWLYLNNKTLKILIYLKVRASLPHWGLAGGNEWQIYWFTGFWDPNLQISSDRSQIWCGRSPSRWNLCELFIHKTLLLLLLFKNCICVNPRGFHVVFYPVWYDRADLYSGYSAVTHTHTHTHGGSMSKKGLFLLQPGQNLLLRNRGKPPPAGC